METRHPPVECWKCGLPLDAATGFNTDDAPEDGDTSVCIGCAVVGVFTHDEDGNLSIVKPTIEQEFEIYKDTTVQKMVFAIKYAKSKDPDNWPKGPRENA